MRQEDLHYFLGVVIAACIAVLSLFHFYSALVGLGIIFIMAFIGYKLRNNALTEIFFTTILALILISIVGIFLFAIIEGLSWLITIIL